MRILLAGLLWLPLLVLFELSTKGLVTLLTEAASFNHDSLRSDTCQVGKCRICVSNMATMTKCVPNIFLTNMISHLSTQLGLHRKSS